MGHDVEFWATTMTAIAVAVSTLSLLALLRQGVRQDAEVLFAVVSGSLALSLMSPWMSAAPAWMRWAAAIGGSATCNGFWLVSRALFRGEGGVRLPHVLLAAGVALLIAIHRGSAMHTGASLPASTVVIDALLTLTSTSLLALSFTEPLRGWSSQWMPAERRMRLWFLTLYGSSVLSTSLLGALASAFPALRPWREIAVALCASLMIVVTHLALRHRRRVPPPSNAIQRRHTGKQPPSLCEDDIRLVALLQHQFEVQQVYREPDLRIAELAARLGTAEYRLSRLISQHLGEKNFNQMLNRYRVAHACRLLASPDGFMNVLHVSNESGFASLGPFNRAFRALVGCTPTAYRARCLEEDLPVRPSDGSSQSRPNSAHLPDDVHGISILSRPATK